MSGNILICGNDSELLYTRGLVLAQMGREIVSACTGVEVAEISSASPVELAVIGHGLAEGQQRQLADLIRQRWSAAKILYLVKTQRTAERISDFEFTCGSLEPQLLIETCRNLLD